MNNKNEQKRTNVERKEELNKTIFDRMLKRTFLSEIAKHTRIVGLF